MSRVLMSDKQKGNKKTNEIVQNTDDNIILTEVETSLDNTFENGDHHDKEYHSDSEPDPEDYIERNMSQEHTGCFNNDWHEWYHQRNE